MAKQIGGSRLLPLILLTFPLIRIILVKTQNKEILCPLQHVRKWGRFWHDFVFLELSPLGAECFFRVFDGGRFGVTPCPRSLAIVESLKFNSSSRVPNVRRRARIFRLPLTGFIFLRLTTLNYTERIYFALENNFSTAALSSLPCRFLAMTFPDLSIKTFAGREVTV